MNAAMDGITVVKVGGNALDRPDWVAGLARGVARRGAPIVVVHGGGRGVSEAQRVLGGEPVWHEGLRVTDAAALRAALWVLSGEVNKRLVGALLDVGVDAVGISGEDGGLLRARVSHGGALGRTGEIESVRAPLLRAWLEQGLTPVVAPVSRGTDGGALNVNADDAACAVARALRAEELLLVSDVPAVRGAAGPLAAVSGAEVERLIETGVADGGMAPKLRAAARAASACGRVRIGGPEMLYDRHAGTRVAAVTAEAA